MLIFIVFDPFKLDVGIELENTFKQLKVQLFDSFRQIIYHPFPV